MISKFPPASVERQSKYTSQTQWHTPCARISEVRAKEMCGVKNSGSLFSAKGNTTFPVPAHYSYEPDFSNRICSLSKLESSRSGNKEWEKAKRRKARRMGCPSLPSRRSMLLWGKIGVLKKVLIVRFIPRRKNNLPRYEVR